MTEKLDRDEDINALPSLIRAEIALARRALDGIEDDAILGVHEARKAIKKARSNARLMRKMDKTASKRINAAGRRASHTLEEARDADSLQQIARAAAIKCSDDALAKALRAEADRARADSQRIDRQAAATQCRHNLDLMEQELDAVKRSENPDKAMIKGLARTYGRAVKRLDAARDDPNGETLHELRKRVKDWRYHVTALKHVWPGGLKRRKSKTHKLSDILGDHHDLVRLIDRLDDRQGASVSDAMAALKDNRDKRARRALKTAKKIFKHSKSDVKKQLKAAL